MTWALWLAVPVVVTVLAALYAWVRARPARPPTPDEAMQAHRDYLEALSLGARVVDDHRGGARPEDPPSAPG